MLLKDRWKKGQKCQQDEKEDVRCHWMSLKEQEDTGNGKRKHQTAL
jgi:hypothetical protein